MIFNLFHRINAAFTELLSADADVDSIAEGRYHVFGDESHRAVYPCVLFNVADSNVSDDWRLGWYEYHYQILGSTYRPDDKDKVVLGNLVGAIRAFSQREDLVSAINSTTSATTAESAITFAAARLENDVQDEEGMQSQVYRGITLRLIVAPHNDAAINPDENQPTGD